ncbi:interferon-induced very large GTPase 1-like [Macrobrachium nipponense]|uniref:interferon-induced very large GTPase 1-like n=1 Tax=Macrobrachium nipponense TaxID=159736 RepID=UPI0030C8AAAC
MDCDDQPLPDEDTCTHSLTDESSCQAGFVLDYSEMEESGREEDGKDLDIRYEETEDRSTKRQEEIISNLGLTEYFEENKEISVQTAMIQSSNQRDSMVDIPWFVLLKLLMLDYRGRDDIVSDVIRNSSPTVEDVSTNQSGFMSGLDDIFSQLENETSSTEQSHLPHPMDVLTTLILCSSNFLRQILCEKLYMCKLSIPLIIPQVLEKDSMFLLWSLRSTILEHRLPSGELGEASVVKCHIPIVSCLRLGEISRSKSRFLNEIINDQNHPTFFHRDCMNGMYQRILSEGALEIAWYYPVEENRDSDCLGRNVAIMNLRGDGKLDRAFKGKKFLCTVSNVVLVIIDVDELRNPDSMESLRLIVVTNIQLILMLTNKTKTKLNVKNKESIRHCVEILKPCGFLEENIIVDFHAGGEKNLKALKSETMTRIKKCLEREYRIGMTIEECKDVAQNLNITVDENSLECNNGKEKASALLEIICKDGTNNLKAKHLPLQCRPWQEWAKLNTEEHRQEKKGNDSIASYMDGISNKMRKLRQEQLRLFEKHDILQNIFMNFDPKANHLENLYFLQWLKLYLDEISRRIIPDLQKQCSEKWNDIRRSGDDEICEDLQNELEKCEKELAESSFGIEHFFREVAQAYEAIQYMGSKEMKQKIHHLPRIMAKLMLHGHPLEVMDGDAAHIPLKWVQAVLTQLSEVTNNKKVFVLSVLGIQSSGKSTLLNTMFGLQFAVAAGRCTRGIFAQLLPISEEFCGTKYDYILVLDTEGLRAAELGKAKLKHDNEIATLVIGLGDVTLVNIKGENVSELEDVLQIVIHALLKMRLVNRNLSLQPSCIFVHQNVSAQDASQKLRSGQQKFMETLDKVTEAAGKQEDSQNYTRFKQVINFDIDTDIWYISDLWKGDPPMAPANPGYSENVKKLKQILLKSVMLKRPLHLTIDQFCVRLKDIWDGVLDQNFVFSFRNSLEMDAYNALEIEQSNISWMLKSAEMKWSSSKKNLIVNRDTKLDDLRTCLIRECRLHLEQVYQEAREKLEIYFQNNEYQSLFEQWRVSAMLRLEASYKSLVEKAVENINTEISKRQIKINEKNDIQTNITKIMDEAKKLARELQQSNDMCLLDEAELRCFFNDKWTEWMSAIPQNIRESLDVQREIDCILDSTYATEFTLLNKARKERHHTIVHDNFWYAIEQYILEKTTKAYLLHPFTDKTETALKFLNKLLKKVGSLFSNEGTQTTLKECTKALIDIVRDTIQKMTEDLNFKNEKEFKICIIMFTWQYACFMHHRFLEKKPKQDTYHEMVDYGIQPEFEEVLLQYFPDSATKVKNQIRTRLTYQRSSRNFTVITQKHIKDPKISQEDARAYIQELVNVLFDDVQSYIDEIEIQCFRDIYIEKIIRMIIEMEGLCKDVTALTKTFKIELAVYLCQYSVPMFCDKHKAYLESMDQRLIYERDNYGPCFESFANFYYRSTNEQALASVLSERLCNAIEKAIRVNLRTELVEDIRNNVPELRLKPSFLRAVLHKLLVEDDFEQFYLYLTDRDTCLQQWLSYFIDQYLFTSERGELNRYTKIAFRNIERLLSVTCEMIVRPLPSSSEKSMDSWFEEFIQRVTDKLPLPLQDLLGLADGYKIVSLESFANQLSDKIRNCQDKLQGTFKNHTPDHQKAIQENNIYKLIANECKGCTEKCPFCYAPCSLNTCGHTELGIDHFALAHHPQACGSCRYQISGKLATESCEALVASNVFFVRRENNWIPHLYKNYKKIFPDWKIQGDASVEATPYWKWFLVKYERQLAERYKAERPDIPTSWKTITKEAALKFLEH